MSIKRVFRGLAAGAGLLLTAALAMGQERQGRSGYSYIRMMTGEATVASSAKV